MKKLLLMVSLSVWSFMSNGQPINIPASQFSQVSVPSNQMRFIMTYPPGGLSANPLLASNATVSWPNLIRALELVLTNTVPPGIGSLTNLTIRTANNPGDRFLFVNTNAPGISNQTITYQNLLNELDAAINPTFPWTIVTNGSPTVVVQAQIDSLTNGGVLSFQTGPYSLTNMIITNSIVIEGNGAVLNFPIGLTNALLSTITNYAKPIVVRNLYFDGGTYVAYNSQAYSNTLNNSAEPYYSPYWSNRTGLRVETSGGAIIEGCRFSGFSGNGALFFNITGSQAYTHARLFFTRNQCFSNYIGVMIVGADYEFPGYNGSDSSLWRNWQGEYSQVTDNATFANQFGVVAGAGNASVINNQMQNNWISLGLFPGANSTHGNYSENNFNHSQFAIWDEANSGGGKFNDNMMLAIGSVHFNGVYSITFMHNKLGTGLLEFTNGCTGRITDNTFLFNTAWGTNNPANGIVTNFTGSRLVVAGNISDDATNSDLSPLSLLMLP